MDVLSRTVPKVARTVVIAMFQKVSKICNIKETGDIDYYVRYRYIHSSTQADLIMESYANYKDHLGPGLIMLHFKLHFFGI